MIKQSLNSVIAKYRDLSVSRRSIICRSQRLRQIIYLLASDKSRYFAQPRPIIVNRLHILKFTHLWHKGLLPVLFQSYFQYANSIHGYNTRYASKQNLYKPKERTNSGKQTVAFAASVLWDNIPVDLKNLNVFNFSKKIKTLSAVRTTL